MVLYNKRSGFTLIELTVVIGIMVVLMALLLPAVQRVREAANALICKSNLRQIGIALHSYHTAKRMFPPGCSYENKPGTMKHASWSLLLSPYLEADAILREAQAAYQTNVLFVTNPPHIAAQRAFRIYICPSDGREQRAIEPKMGLTNYLGCEGNDYLKKDGILFLNSQIRIADITDGVSNTILVGERPPSQNGEFGWWYGGWGQNYDGSADTTLGVRELNAYGTSNCDHCPPGPYEFRMGGDFSDFFHFWSHHPGGAHFLMADGSAHFFTYGANRVLPALATRKGKERVTVIDAQ